MNKNRYLCNYMEKTLNFQTRINDEFPGILEFYGLTASTSNAAEMFSSIINEDCTFSYMNELMIKLITWNNICHNVHCLSGSCLIYLVHTINIWMLVQTYHSKTAYYFLQNTSCFIVIMILHTHTNIFVLI